MLIGHQKQRQFLKKIAESGKIPHAFLFSGQEKLGKKIVAIEWISSLFNQSLKNHPDFILVTPPSSRGGGQIQIDQIRELSWRLSLKPFKAPMMAAVLDSAHSMTIEAQNCFLKTLEEPKGKTILILITEYPNFLLPTILSRCEIVKFYPVAKTEIEHYLRNQKISEKKIQEISKISQNLPGLAVDLISNPQKIEERKEKIKDLMKILNSDLALRFQYARDLAKSQKLNEILKIWMSYFREVLLSKIKNEKLTISEFSRLRTYSFSQLKNTLEFIRWINFLISTTNVNPRLAFEILMLEL